jgi:hypothetical protein
MRRLGPGLRRLAASLLLVAALVAAFAIGGYKELDTHVTLPGGEQAQAVRSLGVEVTPTWTIPVAVAVGILGLAAAVLMYRGRYA